MNNSQITHWCHEIMKSQAPKGGFYIDATMGKGNDTAFFCELAGEEGKVLAFDVQVKAIEATAGLLLQKGLADRATLIMDGHEKMKKYAKPETADVICFNFGYLPGGDHNLATKASTSIIAIEQGLTLLKKGGLLSLCIYSGGDSGFEERDALLSYLKELDTHKYLVILSSFYNRPNNPPIPVLIKKL